MAAMSVLSAIGAEQTTVAHWEFTTGYDVATNGTTAVYTPNDAGWAATANEQWAKRQPYFLPNTCAMSQEECQVTAHTSDGKWQLTTSGSTPSYLLRLNTASTDKFTAKADYADGSKHDQFFEVSMPTTALTNVRLNFAIGDGSSSSTRFGVVYSTDGGQTWTVLNDYAAASHWNSYNDATYELSADNKESLIVRMLIQSATKTSNYNLKYLNILADDFQAPELAVMAPADGETNVVTTGKIIVRFNESVVAKAGAAGTLTNNATKKSVKITPVVNNLYLHHTGEYLYRPRWQHMRQGIQGDVHDSRQPSRAPASARQPQPPVVQSSGIVLGRGSSARQRTPGRDGQRQCGHGHYPA